MSKEHELPSDSDDDDEDYVPEGCEPVSEVESEGDAESAPEDENDENRAESNKSKGRKRTKGDKKKSGKRRKSAIVEKEAEREEEECESDKPAMSEEEEKKRADSLWADFMKDTGTSSKPKPQKQSNGSLTTSPVVRPKIEEKVKITKIFEFAGEEVKVEKEVSSDSAEARLSLPNVEKSSKTETTTTTTTSEEMARGPSSRGRRVGLGGISSVLGQIGKKSKISTLEKSKLDWDSFKREENIDDEINTHNRGKDGYLERQDFLQRADVRQFEIEKQMRISRRSNR